MERVSEHLPGAASPLRPPLHATFRHVFHMFISTHEYVLHVSLSYSIQAQLNAERSIACATGRAGARHIKASSLSIYFAARISFHSLFSFSSFLFVCCSAFLDMRLSTCRAHIFFCSRGTRYDFLWQLA